MKRTVVLAIVFQFCVSARAQTQEASEAEANAAFCKYTTEDALAVRDQLRAPTAQFGLSQPSVAVPAQGALGVSTSLNNWRKSSQTVQVAKQTCQLYDATVEAQRHIFYALPAIEKDVLKNRLRLIQESTDFLDSIIGVDQKKVEAKDLTVTAVYTLVSAKVRLDSTRTTTLTGIVSPYVPPLNDVPLRELVAEKLAHEKSAQAASVKLEKLNNWDVSVEAGGRRQIMPGTNTNGVSSTAAYGGFTFSYNLGRKAINRHEDAAAGAYLRWKETQFDDVAQQALILNRQIIETIEVQEEQLKVLQVHRDDIEQKLKSLEGIETNASTSFRNELLANQAILNVDLGDVAYRISRLKQYLADNF